MIGTTLGHYVVLGKVGEGGMGTVYRARDTVLDRVVAIKVLEVADGDARRRLLHEARAASALNHPNIVTIHAVEQQDDMAFIVMEHVEGVPLDRLIPPSGFPLAEALRHALGIADALAAAHAHGIVHRDIKPGNVMVGPGGRVKVLDFGIARRTALPSDVTRPPTLDGTFSGVVAGTPGYMAPEQVSGQSAGPPSDVFALGALLFHLLTGRGPFAAPSTWAVLDATVRSEPPPLTALKPGTPSAVTALVARALAKDPAARYPSGRELHAALADALAAVDGAGARRPSQARRAALVAAALVLAAAAGGLWWMRSRDARLRWVHEEAIPEISRLASTGDAMATFRLGQRALAIAPDDARLLAAWDGATNEVPISSEPDGAELAVQSLTGGDGEWSVIGTTPLTAVLPFGQIRYRLSKPGYETREFVPNPFPETLTLVRTGEGPPGMVHVPAGDVERADERAASVPDFWIDATEVTNRQFKAFVDAGGYTRRELWTVPFVDGGRTLSWDEAMTRFRDATGRPGPSTWELGTFPDGAADHPVSGVSWYEAAAYATHAGRALPTIYHWRRAAGVSGIFSDVLQLGNFGGRGPQAVGVSRCLSPFGAADMMGNVKEWVWNESRAGVRFVLGGAWFEAMYAASDEDARAPFTRDAGFGFRTMLARAPVDEALQRAVVSLDRDPASMVPVGDEVFAGYKRLYDYDARPLDARVDERDDSHPQWIVERVSMAGAYGDERLPVILLLPR